MDYDILIIGAGPGGYETAAEAARQGLNTAIVERGFVGGTCLNHGCIPTKALCHCAQVLRTVRSAEAYGIGCGTVTADYSAAARHKAAVVEQLRQGVTQLMSAPGITLINGEASIADAHTVSIDGGKQTLTASHIVIATGSEPRNLPIPGADLAMTSGEALAMTSLPRQMCVIGGGVIGMEFAGIFAAYGVEVTVVEYCKEILPPFDKDVAKRLRTVLQKQGVKFITQAAVTAIGRTAAGLTVSYDLKGKPQQLECQKALMAVGRQPVLPEGLEQAGVAVGRRGIEVDSHMMASVPSIYAIGDVNGQCMLAHAATAQGMVALAHITGKESAVKPGIVPSAVFTQPELAMVGLTEEQCKAQELDVTVKKGFFRSNGKALSMGETDGLVKMIVSNTDRTIVGCHICGPHASDLIQEVVMAMNAGSTVGDLAASIHGHPTLSEAVQAVARQF